ncbi:MAG: histone deacetylase, partial [Candidatus Sericytochromatia bacterium]
RYLRTQELLGALGLPVLTPGPVSPEALHRVHPPAHAERIRAFCASGGGRIDEDTVASIESHEVALRSAGAAVAAVDAVLTDRFQYAVSLGRPPGHHALAEATMGFCFFNNAAIAARHAQAAYGLKRVAILDWDLHHGNGTEAIFYEDPSVLYLSTHQDPNWPGTGQVSAIGAGAGAGANVNVPLPIGTGDAGYLRVFRELLAPVMAAFAPELIILSAGFDAHWRDPLGRMGLSVAGFEALTREVAAWAERHAGGRLVVLQEGGYNLDALAYSMLATVRTLVGAPVEDPLGPSPYHEPIEEIEAAIGEVRRVLAPYYRLAPASAG